MANRHLKKPDVGTVSAYFGTSVDIGTKTILQFDQSGVSRHKKSQFPGDFESTLANLGVFELRGFWITEGGSYSHFLKIINYRLAGNQFLKQSKDGMTLHFKGKFGNATQFLRYQFDAESQMPISYTGRLDELDGGKDLELPAGGKGKFKWQQMKNVYLPKRLTYTNWVELDINHQAQQGYQDIVIDFHWFAFNDENYENDELDEASCFESKEKFFASIDPAILGVTFDKIEDKAKPKSVLGKSEEK